MTVIAHFLLTHRALFLIQQNTPVEEAELFWEKEDGTDLDPHERETTPVHDDILPAGNPEAGKKSTRGKFDDALQQVHFPLNVRPLTELTYINIYICAGA
jgi:hypothetical protein